MAVREATRAEWPAIADLTTAVYADLAADPPHQAYLDYLTSIRRILLHPDARRRLVVDVDGEIAASVLLCPPSDGPAGGSPNPDPEIRLLAVRPDRRNRGLAGLLVTACEEQARRDGYTTMSLHTTVLMPTAKAMYERRGYQRAPELDFEPGPDFVVWGYRRALG